MQANTEQLSPYTLGIDLGVASVGLALVDVDAKQLIHTAVCVFPTGVDGNFESGRDESRNVKRRQARLARRQTMRRARRLKKVFGILQRAGLLPEGERNARLNELDRRLARGHSEEQQTRGVPYLLRVKALSEPLTKEELGRALFHLAQRRGFLSNRKAAAKADEERGKVKEGIRELNAEMVSAGASTLGKYFAGLPMEKRIRTHYTSRKWYQAEFDAIWTEQEKHHADVLTEDLRSVLWEAIFHQRRLRDQSDKIGRCSLMPGEERAAEYELDAQRFRILDRVNNLRLRETGERLNEEQRAKLAEALNKRESMTYGQVRTLLGLSKTAAFSIEDGKEKSIPGNKTWARFADALNLRWEQMARPEQEELVKLWAEADGDEEFAAALRPVGIYSQEEIERLCEVGLPTERMSFSLTAMRKLLPLMEQGLETGRARREAFPESFQVKEPLDRLPPVMEALPELRNPAVLRSLTMLRKAVNEAIRKHGKPREVHIELARDLKRNKKERQKWTEQNRENEARRERARAALQQHGLPGLQTADGNVDYRRADIEKYLLWDECGRICPYTGKSIDFYHLYTEPQFEVEHIIPRSRSLDDSFANKTLCWYGLNKEKRNRTPWEAFGSDEHWGEMVSRVKSWGVRGKHKRFTMEETDTEKLLKEFSSRELNDTRYMSKLAVQYLALLHGGISDATKKRVYATAGAITAQLRSYWGLNGILNADHKKTREDHRHHAVDAAAVAMCTDGMVKRLSDESGRAEEAGQRRLKDFPAPWAGFTDQVRDAILNRTVVSHKPERKLAGALHKETHYGKPYEVNGKRIVHIRKPVDSLTAKEVGEIVDSTVKQRVLLQLALVGNDPQKLKGDMRPALETRDGRRIPIKAVRIKEVQPAISIGKGVRQRFVVSKDNHHMEVVAVRIAGKKGKAGATKYEGCVVSRLEANRRHGKGEPVVRRDHGEDREFLFTLSEGDMVRWKGEIWRVRGVTGESSGRMTLSKASDARLKKELEKDDLLRPSVNVFCSTGGRKVRVSPLGVISEAND